MLSLGLHISWEVHMVVVTSYNWHMHIQDTPSHCKLFDCVCSDSVCSGI